MGDSVGWVFLTAIFLVIVALYFLPSLIARQRRVEAWGPLLAVNILLGWTVVGWIACLLWAALGQTEDQAAFYARATRDLDRG